MGTILLWITGALLFGLICKHISLPVVLGFIAAGYCFGVTSFADKEGILTIPSEIGVELLLFSLGLKIKPSSFLNPDLILVFFIHSIAVAMTYYLFVFFGVQGHARSVGTTSSKWTHPRGSTRRRSGW